MDLQHLHPHPHPHPHPPKPPLIMRNSSSGNRELLMLPSPLTRIMQRSRPTHTNQPNPMHSNQIMLPHTTKDKARVGPLPRIHMHNQDKDKTGIMPLHNNNRDTINHSRQLRPLKGIERTRRLNQGITDISTDIFWCIAKAHTVTPTRTTQQTGVVSRDLDGEIAKIAVSLTIWPIQRIQQIQRTQQIHRHKLTTPGAVVKTSSP